MASIEHPLDADCIGLWRLNESNSTDDAVDSSSNLIDATRVDNSEPPCIVGKFNGGRNVNGPNSPGDPTTYWRLSVPWTLENASIYSIPIFTVAGWVYWNGTNCAAWEIRQYLFSIEETTGNPLIGLGINTTGNPIFELALDYSGSKQLKTITDTDILPSNEWVHFACTWDETTMCLYINGVLKASSSAYAGHTRYYGYNNSCPSLGASSGGYYNIRGYIDDIAIYSTPKSQSWITSIYMGHLSPNISLINPINESTDVVINPSIIIDITDTTYIIDTTLVTISLNGTTIYSSETFISGYIGNRSSITNGYRYTFSRNINFPLNKDVTIVVYAINSNNDESIETFTFSIVDITYNTILTPVNELYGGINYPSHIGTESTYVDSVNPYTNNKIEGWRWDDKTWTIDNEDNTYLNIPLITSPSYSNLVASGITTQYFQSGVGPNNDLYINRIDKVLDSGINTDSYESFSPTINHGYYYNETVKKFIYSDSSEIIYPSQSGIVPGLVESYSMVSLTNYPKFSIPITAQSYQWNSSIGQYDIYKEYNKKPYFTGITVSGIEQSTFDYDTGVITYENIDNTDNEFICIPSGLSTSYPKIIFNKQVVESHGDITVSGVPNFSTIDRIGYYNGTSIKLTYSPVYQAPTPIPYITVWTWNESITNDISNLQEWTVITSGTPTGYQCFLDIDLGTIDFSGTTKPSYGQLVGSIYYSTVHIEYEPEYTINSLEALEVDTSPTKLSEANGYICLLNYESEIINISLSIESVPVLSSVSDIIKYGPLSSNMYYAKLVATATDIQGNPVPNKEITFNITTSPSVGKFSNNSSSITAITNGYGIAYAYYIPPRNIDDFSFSVSNLSQDGDTTSLTITANKIDIGSLSDIYTFGTYYTTGGDEIGKIIISEWNANSINPHTDVSGAFTPKRPTAVTLTGTNTYVLDYDNSDSNLPFSYPGSDDGATTYFVYVPFYVSFQATTGIISSSNIDLKISLPGYSIGTWIVDDGEGSTFMEIFENMTNSSDTGKEVVLGWRVRSQSVSLASAIDACTFTTINATDDKSILTRFSTLRNKFTIS